MKLSLLLPLSIYTVITVVSKDVLAVGHFEDNRECLTFAECLLSPLVGLTFCHLLGLMGILILPACQSNNPPLFPWHASWLTPTKCLLSALCFIFPCHCISTLSFPRLRAFIYWHFVSSRIRPITKPCLSVSFLWSHSALLVLFFIHPNFTCTHFPLWLFLLICINAPLSWQKTHSLLTSSSVQNWLILGFWLKKSFEIVLVHSAMHH